MAIVTGAVVEDVDGAGDSDARPFVVGLSGVVAGISLTIELVDDDNLARLASDEFRSLSSEANRRLGDRRKLCVYAFLNLWV